MKILEWNGIIGWEIYIDNVKQQLKDSNGEDLTIRFSSQGGSIFEGVDIYSALIDHKKDNPNIKMTLEIKALAASMGSFIASSDVWDKVMIEPTSMIMIHNPWSYISGDYREMRKEADFLENARILYSDSYAKRSGKTKDEVLTIMDNETWYMGQQIIDEGFADEMAGETEDNIDSNMLITKAKNDFMSMKKLFKDKEEKEKFDEKRAVACLGKINMQVESNTIPEESGVNQMEVTVDTKQELQKEKPEIYKESVNDGIMQERDRVKTLSEMKAKDEFKAIPEVVASLDKAILEGNSVTEATTMMNAAMVTVLRNPNMSAQLDSAGDFGSGDQEKPVMKNKKKIGEV